MVMACCNLCYKKYLNKDGEVSKKCLDEIFGKNKYQLIIEKKPYNKKAIMDQIYGENNYSFVEGGVKPNGSKYIHNIKGLDKEFEYKYKVKIDNKEQELCGCDCHIIGMTVLH